MKKILALFITVAMLVTVFPVYAREGIKAEFDGVTGELCLSGYGSITSEEISSVQKELDTESRGVVSVIIEGNITEIDDGAFRECRTVKKITVTAPIKRIGQRAFEHCIEFKSINLPDSIEEIDDYAFGWCNLEFIRIPDGVRRIGKGAFCANEKLEELILNDNLTEICDNAFADCKALEIVSVPETVEMVGFNAFRGTPWINNQPKPLYMGKALIKYYSDKPEESESEVAVIKEGTLSISANAFQGNKKLKKLIMPDSVISIGYGENLGMGAFNGCTNLEEIKLSKNIKEISNKMFYNCINLRKIDIPDGVEIICDSAFNGCTSLSEVNIPQSVDIIGYAFADTAWYNNLSPTELINGNLIKAIPDSEGKVSIPDGTVRIMPRLLYENQEVKTVVIPESVKNIGYCAFSRCLNLTDINIPRGVVEIEDNAFEESSVQGEMIIPETVEKIGKKAIRKTNISSLDIKSNADTCNIGEASFSECSFLKNAKLNSCIAKAMLKECTLLEETEIGMDVTEIPESMFELCMALEEVKIPQGVIVIKEKAFNGCISISKITLPEALTELEKLAFGNCIELTEITVPQKVHTIGQGAFAYSNNLKKVNLPDGLRYIDDQAFYKCTTLSDITLPKTLEEIGDSVFEATSLQKLIIPDNVRKIGGYICDNIDEQVDIYVSENTAMEPFAFMGNNIVVHAPRNSRAYRMATDCGARTVITGNMVVGEVYDKIIPTDIITTINGTKVNSYAIYGETIILLRDLENAGFNVCFDESTKTAYADYVPSKKSVNKESVALSNDKLLYTDIKVKVNGIGLKGYNTNGYMAIVAEDLGRYVPGMTYEWVNEERTLKLYIE